MRTCFFVCLKCEHWYSKLASVEAIHYAAFGSHYKVMFYLMMPLSALNVLAHARIKFVRQRTVAVTDVKNIKLRVIPTSEQNLLVDTIPSHNLHLIGKQVSVKRFAC